MISQSEFTRRRVADDDIFDERGIIRDGKRLRVSMADAKPMPLLQIGTVPRNITTGLRMDKIFYPDGTEKPARTPRAERQLPAADSDRYGANRPGFRTSDATVTADAGQALKDAAYEAMVRENERAWMPDHMRAADARRTTVDAARPQGISDAEWARAEGIRQMSDAWRQDAAAVATPPAGAYAPVGYGANEGDIVTWNGAPARLVKRGNWLFPEVHQQGATRSGTSSGDAQPGTREFVDQEWRAMVDRISNEWRT